MSLQIEVEELDSVRRRLVVHVPAEKVAGEIESAVRELARTVRVPGFRPGRAPRGVLEKRYGERLQADVHERLVRESLVNALEQERIVPVGPPQIVTEPANAGEGLRYSATVEVKPNIVAADYRGIAVERPLAPFDEANVGRMLEGIRQRQAQLQPIEGRDQAEMGDVVTVDIEGNSGGKPLKRAEAKEVELGAPGVFPEVDAALRGVRVGDIVTANVEFPAGHQDPDMAGRQVALQLTVRGLFRKALPELDDEFAKDVSDCTGIEELRALVRSRIQAEAAQRADAVAQKAALDELVRRNAAIEVPRAMVERNLESMIDEVRQEWTQRRLWPSSESDIVHKLRVEFEPEARNRVKLGLLLEAIARQENLAAEEGEIDEAIEAAVARANDAAPQAETYYRQPEVRAALRSRILQSKVVDFILAQAQVTTVEKENDVADIEESD